MNPAVSSAPASFAELCYQHTFASCGCGMCKAGDVCPTPVLKLEDSRTDEEVSPRFEGMFRVEEKH